MKLLQTLRVCAVVITTGLVLLGSPGAASYGEANKPIIPPYCDTTVDNPHYSSGNGGNIVKARTVCHENVYQARVGVDLFKCPHSPTGNKDTWGNQGCAIVKVGSNVFNQPFDGSTYTTYAPPVGTAGAHGAGYYVGVAITTIYNSAGSNQGLKTSFSSIVYLSS